MRSQIQNKTLLCFSGKISGSDCTIEFYIIRYTIPEIKTTQKVRHKSKENTIYRANNSLLFFQKAARNTGAICQDKLVQGAPQVVIKGALRNEICDLHLCGQGKIAGFRI